MSLLSELNTIAESCGVPVETGVFSDAAPDTYWKCQEMCSRETPKI